MNRITRRDFLKLASVTGGALFAAGSGRRIDAIQDDGQSLPNIIIIVFDAMSARNLSLYGYPRNTSPNLERFANHALVYHSHYAGGSFTTPGTASLLTGTYPWTHRAINLYGVLDKAVTRNNVFNLVGNEYYRLAFSQNILPNFFLEQFSEDLDMILNPASFSVTDHLFSSTFGNDKKNSYRAQIFSALEEPTVMAHSLLFGPFVNYLEERDQDKVSRRDYPLGMPQAQSAFLLFTLQGLMDGIADSLENSKKPYLHYYHIMAPHAPYRPDKHFYMRYEQDNFAPVVKNRANFDAFYTRDLLDNDREIYDEFIANIDDEFGRLLDRMEHNKVFDDSYVIVTSDHGEMFERGVEGHLSRHLYEPGIQIPLLISTPGQGSRKDIYTPTNSVDLLPTLLQNTQRDVPEWCEGVALPGLGGVEDMNRSIYTVEAKSNSAFQPITKATITMRKGDYKIVHYTGYSLDDYFEFYDIRNDPEELNDLFPLTPSISKSMREELLENVHKHNEQFKTRNQ